MKTKSKSIALCVAAIFPFTALLSNATIVGGVDPTTTAVTGLSDGASDVTVISAQFTHTTTVAETIDLSLSTFSYNSNSNAGTSAGTPFLAVQASPGSHVLADYDVIWVGTGLGIGAAGTDVSAALGASTLVLPAASTIVGGFFGSAAGGTSPVTYANNTAAGDVLILAQVSVDVTNDLTPVGVAPGNWSANDAVNARGYHYQIDLQPFVVPEPSTGILFALVGCVTLVARRRRR